LNIKIKIEKSAKFHVTSGVVSYKSGSIYKMLKNVKMLKYQEELTLSRMAHLYLLTVVWVVLQVLRLLIHQRRGDRAVGSGGFLSYDCYCLSLLRS
jgi:hypothetical protein